MTQNLGLILKKNQVKLSGTCRIGAPAAAHAAKPASSAAAQPSAQPTVRIVDRTDQNIVLEFTCPCGQKTYIQCDYE